jgi:hypothetical protein
LGLLECRDPHESWVRTPRHAPSGMAGMVAMVRDLPREVWRPEEAVGNLEAGGGEINWLEAPYEMYEANNVVDDLQVMVRVSAVTTFMTNGPDTGGDETLEPPAA